MDQWTIVAESLVILFYIHIDRVEASRGGRTFISNRLSFDDFRASIRWAVCAQSIPVLAPKILHWLVVAVWRKGHIKRLLVRFTDTKL